MSKADLKRQVWAALTDDVSVDRFGTKRWVRDDELHNEHGPAVEWFDGTKWWYINGKRHREGAPAIEWADGSTTWYLDDELHNESGPAISDVLGGKSWFIHGDELTEDQFNEYYKQQNA